MQKFKASIGKMLIWVLALVFLWLIVTHFTQTTSILAALGNGRWYWILLAVICQIIFYPFYAIFLEHIFSLFNVNLGRRNLLSIYIASKFTDVALPIATVGKVAIFVRQGKRSQVPPLNIGIGIGFVVIFELTAFLIISWLTMIALLLSHQPHAFLQFTLLIFSLIIAVVLFFTVRLIVTDKTPGVVFLWVMKTLARISGQKGLDLKEIETVFVEAGNDLKKNARKILPGFVIALSTHLINLITFALIYLAFVGHFNLFAILATFVAGLLFTIVSITPQGVGVAETVMVATLHSFGLDVPQAAVITLAYRGLLYWLPFFLGFYFFSRLELKNNTNNK